MKAVLALCLVAACLGAAVASQKPCVDEWCLEADVPDFVELDVLFAVKQRNLEALDDVFWAVSTPGSPKYGEFMTHEELNELVKKWKEDVIHAEKWRKSEHANLPTG